MRSGAVRRKQQQMMEVATRTDADKKGGHLAKDNNVVYSISYYITS